MPTNTTFEIMKFNVSGKLLASQLQAVSKVINAKNAISILDNFLLRLEEDTLYITGSDSDNTLTASLRVEDPEGEGMVVVPCRRMIDVVKEVASQPLSVFIDDTTHAVKVTFSGGEFNFMGLDGSEYPKKKLESEERVQFAIPAKVMVSGLDNTLFAVSTETIRPIMTGIFLDIFNDKIVFVSSDTHKLVRYTNNTVAPGISYSFILPPKPAGILNAIAAGMENDIVVEADVKSATFRFDNFELSCRLIKGKYPDYNRVIPQNNPFKLYVNREALLTATRRVSIFASESSNLISLAISDTDIKLSSQDVDYSVDAFENVPCRYEGNSMMIGFKASYMKEVLSNLKGEEVLVELSDPARPGLFEPSEQKEGEDIVMLQMPMQVFE